MSLLDREDTSPTTMKLVVEMRAATLAEIREIDLTGPETVLPAYLLMTETQWRRSIAAYVGERRNPMTADRHGPPGSLVWAQAASRAGHLMVGGRDRLGFPSFPVPGADGVIRFESLESSNVDLAGGSGMPILRGSVLRDASETCRPMIQADDTVSCGSPDCSQCLQSISLSPWQSAIACLCPDHH